MNKSYYYLLIRKNRSMQFNIKKIITATLLIGVTCIYNAYGQSNTMYYIHGVPQSYQLNPATQPTCDFFLGVPGVSPLQIHVQNSALSINDVIWAEGDSVYHPFHPSVDVDDFLSNFKETNYIAVENDITAFSMGLRIREMYFTFDIGAHMNDRFIYPGDLIDFLVKGNEANDEFDLSGLELDFKNYADIALGVSRNFGDQWTVGLRTKLLFGIANLSTSKSNISLITGADQWVIDTDYEMNFSMPGVIVPIDAEGGLDFDEGFDFDSTLSTVKDYRKLGTQNIGLGFDIGAHFRPIDKLEISASIIDLGYIRWKGYNFAVNQTVDFNYEGVEAERLSELEDIGDRLVDTLVNMFDFQAEETVYSSMITAKVYLGARYRFTDGFDAGALVNTSIIRGKIRPQLTFLADWYPSTVWGVSASYSVLQHSYSSFGIGTSFKFGPLSLYIISDFLPFSYNMLKDPPVPLPNNMRNYSIKFGANLLMLGCNKKKKLRKDKPMLYLKDY